MSNWFRKQIIENLRNIEGIKEINRTTGTFDLLVKLISHEYDSLKKIVRWKIMKIDHIESTIALLCMQRPLCITLD
jgi:DNA-binding Lrp family transcriptional regulator